MGLKCDSKDLYISFTDNPWGSFTERFADLLLKEITSTLTDQDFMFDLHGGPGGTLMEPWVAYQATGDASEEKSRAAAEATGIKVLWKIVSLQNYSGALGESHTLSDEAVSQGGFVSVCSPA